MANKFGMADMEAHFGVGKRFHYLLDWATATGTFTILEAGDHPKMRLKNAIIQNVNAALNAAEPTLNIKHGGNEVVATADMATEMAATAAIGYVADLTLVEEYRILEADESLQVQVESADGGATTRGLMDFEYEAVE